MKRYLVAFGLLIANLGLIPVTLMHAAEGHAASQFYSKTWGINVSPKYLMDDSFPLFAWRDVKSGAAKWSNRVNCQRQLKSDPLAAIES